jgi:hypothetical protein
MGARQPKKQGALAAGALREQLRAKDDAVQHRLVDRDVVRIGATAYPFILSKRSTMSV